MIRFIDLFSGLGGTRLGLEAACDELGIEHECVLSSDKKRWAQTAYKHNFHDKLEPDVTKIDEKKMPDFDFMLGGFPCQPFSRAGNKKGFADTRGTMFFELERILKEKKPKYLLLENVPEILTNDSGRTITVITTTLEKLGYGVSVKVLNGTDFGLPQERRRAFITGILDNEPLDFDIVEENTEHFVMKDIMEQGLKCLETDFTKSLLSSYKSSDIAGYVISDKRRGNKTLHSWDIALHGKVENQEKNILETILSEFRKRKYADELGIRWRDGMPLNLSQLARATGIDEKKLEPMLERLVDLGYLTKKYPFADDSKEQRTDLPIGYKLITSRVSFELNRFLSPDDTCITLTATDASHIGIIDGEGVRRLTIRECLRLFGFPETYDLSCVSVAEAYDLVGNSICVPVVKAVSKAMLSIGAKQ